MLIHLALFVLGVFCSLVIWAHLYNKKRRSERAALPVPAASAGKSPTTQRFNIALVSINDHKAIFEEVILGMQGAFHDLHMPCTRTENEFPDDAINIVIGSAMFVSEPLAQMLKGKPYIVYQMEQLAADHGHLPNFPGYVQLLKQATAVWDYSKTNMDRLSAMGIPNAAYLPAGYHKALETIPQNQEKDIDVLFYGALSPRREAVLNQLKARGVNAVALFGAYGPARDQMIARAKILLNVHAMEINTLEEVRISFLLANRCFVVSEDSDQNPYGDGVVFAPYEQLAEACIACLEDASARENVAHRGYEAIQRIDVAAMLAQIITRMPQALTTVE